jgi:tRNA(fMet)-specific endonuclease VapC
VYVLDSDILSLYQRGDAVVRGNVSTRPPSDVTISVISVEELLSGWYTLLRRVKNRKDLARGYQRLATAVAFLAQFPILPFSEPAILRYEGLLALKLGVKGMDLRIAAIALEHSTVVTRNVRDFQRIPGLVVENWAS